MQEIFEFRNLIMSIAALALMAVKVWAFVDALLRQSEAYDLFRELSHPFEDFDAMHDALSAHLGATTRPAKRRRRLFGILSGN